MADPETRELVEQMVAEQTRHGLRFNPNDRRHQCLCGEWSDSGPGWKRVQHNYHEHVADQLVAHLMSWDFLMALLDKHYPTDIFPTMDDTDGRDPGPRIVSLLRVVDQLRDDLATAQRLLRNPQTLARLATADADAAVPLDFGVSTLPHGESAGMLAEANSEPGEGVPS